MKSNLKPEKSDWKIILLLSLFFFLKKEAMEGQKDYCKVTVFCVYECAKFKFCVSFHCSL